jgi:uncharacterized protein (DUF1501 family)
MLTRRRFLEQSLKGSSLIALNSMVPGFLASAARAASPGKDTILVVLEMTGGNDGLNTVVPYSDDLYYKARPTLGLNKNQLVRVNEHLGLNPGMQNFRQLLDKGQLAIVQGVGYPNPSRSHFDSMDIWQSADPKGVIGTGWLGRTASTIKVAEGQIPGIQVSTDKLPLALQGSARAVTSINPKKPYDLNLGGRPEKFQDQGIAAPIAVATAPPEGPKPGGPPKEKSAEEKHRDARRQLVQELAQASPASDRSMLQFVQRSALQTYTTIDRLREITRPTGQDQYSFYYGEVGQRFGELSRDLNLVARMIQSGFGTRIYYVSINGFDTHYDQKQQHQQLLTEIANAVSGFFNQLQGAGNGERVLLMTFSEFGRRVDENGSKGTDHGAASCLFVGGPGVKGGVVGQHPSLKDLGDGDLKFNTDFRRVYATLLDGWLGCKSVEVLGDKFEPLPLLKKA